MHDLTITPQGHLLVRESLDASDRTISKALLKAYGESPARGMLASASEEIDAVLSAPFEFARSIARLYLTQLCRMAPAEAAAAIPDTPPPSGELEQAVLQAPPMTGLEYLTADVLAQWWRDLDLLVRREIGNHAGGAHGYLRACNPQWRFVGRVTFHLAENKRDPQYPFAFLATYASGLTPQGKVRHEPLGRALQQYAGEQNRAAMLALLLPISKAAESSELIRRLVDSEEIYQPLMWSPREAYDFLQAIPLFESSGLIVRVPDWWNAQKPPRPLVSVKVNSKSPASIGVDAMLQFSVGMSLDGEVLSPEEAAQLLEASGGLIPLRGKWVEVDREKLKEALAHWKEVEKDVRRDGISFFEGMRLLSGANIGNEEEDEGTAAIHEWTGLTAGGELDSVLQSLRTPGQEAAPPGLKAELRPYQQTGYSWLRFVVRLGLGACLADDMGLGKTVQVISLLLDLKRDKQKTACVLIVPASLIANWKSELAKFAPSISFTVIHPSEASAGELSLAGADSFDLIVTTYGMLVRTDWLIAEEIASRQEKVLVFTQFREIADPLAGFLATLFGHSGLVLHGGTSVKKRKEFVDHFQREDGPPFFVLSLKAGGTGLNLTAASHVIHFDRWWNPAIENQATDRVFRIGQKKNVLVHKFICRGTVEERIDEMIAAKSRVANEAIGEGGSGEVLLTEMDNDTLLRLVKLDLKQATDG